MKSVIDLRRVSTIRLIPLFDEAYNVTHYDFKWEGESAIVAVTHDLIADANPALAQFPPLETIAAGDEATIGPFRLRVIENDLKGEFVVFERID